ncbi:MAG: hypothetical protein AAGF11_37260, partial [Myxococcota bacterium]
MKRVSLLSIPLTLSLGTVAATALGTTVMLAPTTAEAASNGTISGVITNKKTKERLAEALVILQCSCLQGTRETQTNSNGLY